jgi:ectoine hydroxylase-related dioxygenase (phytanoyl-CoA dioxygenase family)
MNTLDYKDQLDTLGYAYIPELITPEQCEHYKELLEQDYKKYSSFYDGYFSPQANELANKSGEMVVFNMHNKDLSWFTLFEHPVVLSLLDATLKEGSHKDSEPYYLNNISARCPMKGHLGQQLHLDSNLPGINYVIIVNVLWMLDDFTLENGATRVVPGSHKFQSYAPDGIKHPDEIQLTGKKGGVVVFNANLWHGSAENTTDETRWSVPLGYARWFIKPSFDFMQNTPLHIYNNMTDEQKNLLGFRLVPPKDEFTRMRRRSLAFETPYPYQLPDVDNNTFK